MFYISKFNRNTVWEQLENKINKPDTVVKPKRATIRTAPKKDFVTSGKTMWKSDLPSIIIAGTTIEWVDEATTAGINETISSPDWTLEYYLRTNTASEGHTATGTQYANSTGWQFTISATDSAGFDAGNWFWAARAFKSGKVFEIGTGELEVKQSLQYSGTPAAIDNRTQTEKDLDAVTA